MGTRFASLDILPGMAPDHRKPTSHLTFAGPLAWPLGPCSLGVYPSQPGLPASWIPLPPALPSSMPGLVQSKMLKGQLLWHFQREKHRLIHHVPVFLCAFCSFGSRLATPSSFSVWIVNEHRELHSRGNKPNCDVPGHRRA